MTTKHTIKSRRTFHFFFTHENRQTSLHMTYIYLFVLDNNEIHKCTEKKSLGQGRL